MIKRMIVIFSGSVLLIAAAVAVVVASLNRQLVPLPEAPMAQTPAGVRVKAVERNVETLDFSTAETAKFLSRGPRRTSTEFGIGERTMRILFIVLIPVALILMIMSGLVMYLWGVANALREGNPFKQIIEYGFKRDISDYIKFLAERSGKMPLVGACVALIGALLLVGFFIAIS